MNQADKMDAVKNFGNAFENIRYDYSDARVREDYVPKLAENLKVTPKIAQHFALYYFVFRNNAKNYIKPDYSNSKKAELDEMLVEPATTIGLDRASIDELKKFILEKAYEEKARLERALQPHIQRFRSRSNRSRKSRSKRNRKTRKSRK
jgi:hypothetical protein